jgi:chromosome segregation ATPase
VAVITCGAPSKIWATPETQYQISEQALTELKESFATLQAESQVLRRLLDEQKATIASYADLLVRLRGELHTLETHLTDSQALAESQKQELKRLRRQLEELKAQLHEALLHLRVSQEEMEILSNQVTALQWWAYGATAVSLVLGGMVLFGR